MADLVIIDIEESDDDVFFLGDPYEGDTFQNSGSSYFRFICSRESRYVVLEMDGNLYGKDLNVRETNRGCKFNIQLYDSTKCNARTTKAIMLCMNTEKDSKCVCVSEDGSNLRFTKQPSSPLPGDSHESIFFLKKLPNSNRYTMESSKIPSSFISFEPVVGRKDMVKVVLRHKDKKEMDETCEISFKPVDPIF